MEVLATWLEPLNLGPESLFLLAMAPFFLGFIAWEAWYWRNTPAAYSLRDTLNNAFLAASYQLADGIAWAAVIGLFYWLYQFRLFEIPLTWWSLLSLFIAQDFLYYWFHRASHRIRWLWASHVVHHSSERSNLSTAFRQSMTYPISGMWAFWLPLALIGFHPKHVVLVVAINLAYQFFIHTEVVRRLGPLELVLNTPSHHRVHHGRNPEYIDRNFGGVLIVWDKLFGTFTPEDQANPPEYGIQRQIHTNNVLTMIFHEWRDMLRDAARPGPLWLRLKHLWAPPEWQRPQHESTALASHAQR
ncbi:MAG: sterol desaturase family protein [Xanthomonadaceae bacterium]|nr:sterol desaturase family protein [Xanthomonadaceae bacterium]